MMPVAPTAKRSNGFTIDSLMGKETAPSRPSTSRTSVSPTAPSVNVTVSAENAPVPAREPTMGGIGSSFHPVHPGSGALLNGLKGLYGPYHDNPYHEGLTALGLPAAAALHAANAGTGHLPPGFHLPSVPHTGLPHHPLLMGAQRDPFAMYPWLLSRHGSYFNHPRLAGRLCQKKGTIIILLQ